MGAPVIYVRCQRLLHLNGNTKLEYSLMNHYQLELLEKLVEVCKKQRFLLLQKIFNGWNI